MPLLLCSWPGSAVKRQLRVFDVRPVSNRFSRARQRNVYGHDWRIQVKSNISAAVHSDFRLYFLGLILTAAAASCVNYCCCSWQLAMPHGR